MRNFIVTINGNQYEVGVEEVTNGQPVVNATPVATAPTAPVAPKAVKTANAKGEKVVAPFPGMFKKMVVANGATVKKGDVIAVFEAMKMDNDINAPCDGVVTFNASVGSNYNTDDVLAVIG